MIDFLKQKWFLQLLGVIAISVLIWFIGPLIAIAEKEPLADEVVRIICIVLIIVFWLISLYIGRLKAAKANQEMTNAIAESVGGPSGFEQESQDEVKILAERFDEAIQILQRTGAKDKNGKRKKTNLYELPWYIIIGPPGSGKTTALINSGLDFPLSEHMGSNAIGGVGGTRNCDWWFTNEAVLLDTAGRYTTQDSHEFVDRSAWVGFLDLLKKHRSRQPINGAIIAMSLSDMMVQTEEERNQHALAIRKRIQELNDHLGVRFPIYVLFTKCDLVAGFSEFFEDLSREERLQVWGHTFPITEADDTRGVVKDFPEAFDQLMQNINSRILARIQDEKDVRRRSQILGFPRRMTMLKEPLNRFLLETFQPNRYQEAPLLRGVYFTSGTQEGTPIDRLLGTLASTFNLDRNQAPSFSGKGRSYFLNHLLRGVMFQESGLVGVNKGMERRRSILQSIVYVSSIAILGAGIVAWATSYTQNESAIAELNSEIETYNQVTLIEEEWSTDIDLLLPELNSARQAAGIFPQEPAMTMQFGLYQGSKLRPAANAAYQRILKKRFYPTIKMRLEERMTGIDASNTEMLYELLKIYLMLGTPDRFEADMVRQWILVDWEQRFAQEPEKYTQAAAHLDALFEKKPAGLKLDDQLIADTRAIISRIPMAQQIFGRLKATASLREDLDFRVADLFSPETEGLFVDKSGAPVQLTILGIFTAEGYKSLYLKNSLSMIKETVAESWVLGETSQGSRNLIGINNLKSEIDKLYFAEYEKQWLSLLNRLYIRRFTSVADTAQAMEHLSGAISPIRLVLEAIAHHTSIAKLSASAEVAKQLTGNAVDKASGRAANLLRQARSASSGKSLIKNPAKAIDRRFAPFHRLLRGEAGNTQLDRLMSSLIELHDYLLDITSASDAGNNSLTLAKGRAQSSGRDPIGQLRRQAVRMPRPVNHWIESLTTKTWGKVLGSAKKQLGRMWKSSVYDECFQSFERRYPFIPASKDESTIVDFGRFFGEGGTIDRFVQNNLGQFIDTNGRNWKLRKVENQSVNLSPGTLKQLQRASKIKELYFNNGGQLPSVSFSLKPLQLDADMAKFSLNLDGQITSYQHGPPRLKTLQWPGPNGSERVTISFESLDGKLITHSMEGPWAWFRMLEASKFTRGAQTDRYKITFELEGHKATFELRARSVINPFQLTELSKFRCPKGL